MTVIKLEDIPAKGDAPLAVKLSLDMSKYCKASRELFEAEAANRATAEQDKAQQDEHSVLVALAGQIAGGAYWRDIKVRFGQMCGLENSGSIFPLSSYELNQVAAPFAIVVFDYYFVEVLKNSIDAIIDRHIDSSSDIDQLSIVFEVVIDDQGLRISATDNAGGVSPEYEAKFNKRIEEKNYKPDAEVSKKKAHPKYYVGGHNLGAVSMLSLTSRGELLDRGGKSKKAYIVPEGAARMTIKNNPENTGAVVTLTSPLEPFPSVEEKTINTHIQSPQFFHSSPTVVIPLVVPGSSSPEIPARYAGGGQPSLFERRKRHLTGSSVSPAPDVENCNSNSQSLAATVEHVV